MSPTCQNQYVVMKIYFKYSGVYEFSIFNIVRSITEFIAGSCDNNRQSYAWEKYDDIIISDTHCISQ